MSRHAHNESFNNSKANELKKSAQAREDLLESVNSGDEEAARNFLDEIYPKGMTEDSARQLSEHAKGFVPQVKNKPVVEVAEDLPEVQYNQEARRLEFHLDPRHGLEVSGHIGMNFRYNLSSHHWEVDKSLASHQSTLGQLPRHLQFMTGQLGRSFGQIGEGFQRIGRLLDGDILAKPLNDMAKNAENK